MDDANVPKQLMDRQRAEPLGCEHFYHLVLIGGKPRSLVRYLGRQRSIVVARPSNPYPSSRPSPVKSVLKAKSKRVRSLKNKTAQQRLAISGPVPKGLSSMYVLISLTVETRLLRLSLGWGDRMIKGEETQRVRINGLEYDLKAFLLTACCCLLWSECL